jgi:hypothetical protein
VSHMVLVSKREHGCTSINSHRFSSKILNCASRSRYDKGAGGGDATTTAVDGGAGAGGGAEAVGSAMILLGFKTTFKTRETHTNSGASRYLKVLMQCSWAHESEVTARVPKCGDPETVGPQQTWRSLIGAKCGEIMR